MEQDSPQMIAARNYENNTVKHTTGPHAAVLIEHASPKQGERVLDVACGTGIVARLAAPLVGSSGAVTGVDINPAMIAVARSVPQPDGPAIDWREANAEALPLPASSVDLVVSLAGLQFIPDKKRALAEMHRVLRPGGRLALSIWDSPDRNPIGNIVWGSLARRLDVSIDRLNPGFTLGDPALLEDMLQGSGFSEIEITSRSLDLWHPNDGIHIPEILQRTAGFLPVVANMSPEERAALASDAEAEIFKGLEAYRDGDGLRSPSTALIGVACRH